MAFSVLLLFSDLNLSTDTVYYHPFKYSPLIFMKLNCIVTLASGFSNFVFVIPDFLFSLTTWGLTHSNSFKPFYCYK